MGFNTGLANIIQFLSAKKNPILKYARNHSIFPTQSTVLILPWIIAVSKPTFLNCCLTKFSRIWPLGKLLLNWYSKKKTWAHRYSFLRILDFKSSEIMPWQIWNTCVLMCRQEHRKSCSSNLNDTISSSESDGESGYVTSSVSWLTAQCWLSFFLRKHVEYVFLYSTLLRTPKTDFSSVPWKNGYKKMKNSEKDI